MCDIIIQLKRLRGQKNQIKVNKSNGKVEKYEIDYEKKCEIQNTALRFRAHTSEVQNTHTTHEKRCKTIEMKTHFDYFLSGVI